MSSDNDTNLKVKCSHHGVLPQYLPNKVKLLRDSNGRVKRYCALCFDRLIAKNCGEIIEIEEEQNDEL